MSLKDWSLDQIETLVARYRSRGLTEGGQFSLSELVLEQKRRIPSHFSGLDVVNSIVGLARKSTDGFITYGQLYHVLSGGLKWKGNATQREMGLALERGIGYCVDNQLPILTVLVVKKTGSHSPEAIQRIYDEAREMGLDVGLDAESFVASQIQLSRKFVMTK